MWSRHSYLRTRLAILWLENTSCMHTPTQMPCMLLYTTNSFQKKSGHKPTDIYIYIHICRPRCGHLHAGVCWEASRVIGSGEGFLFLFLPFFFLISVRPRWYRGSLLLTRHHQRGSRRRLHLQTNPEKYKENNNVSCAYHLWTYLSVYLLSLSVYLPLA